MTFHEAILPPFLIFLLPSFFLTSNPFSYPSPLPLPPPHPSLTSSVFLLLSSPTSSFFHPRHFSSFLLPPFYHLSFLFSSFISLHPPHLSRSLCPPPLFFTTSLNLSTPLLPLLCNTTIMYVLTIMWLYTYYHQFNTFKLVSPSKLAVVTWHFPSGSSDDSNTKSQGNSSSALTFTISPIFEKKWDRTTRQLMINNSNNYIQGVPKKRSSNLKF